MLLVVLALFFSQTSPVAAPSPAEIFQSLRKLSRPSGSAVDEAEKKLFESGREALPWLHGALGDPASVPVIVAARVLGRLKDPTSLDPLSKAFQRNLPPEAARPCLEALFAVDPEKAPDLALPLLDHKLPAVRVAAQDLLDGKLRSEQLPALLALSRSSRDETRTRALRLLGSFPGEGTLGRLTEAFSDLVPEVAAAAAEATARNGDAKTEEKLTALIRESLPERRWGYACLALAQRLARSKGGGAGAFPREALRESLALKDPFVAGSSAVLLAQVGYGAPEGDDVSYLDREVPDALIRTVGRNTFYKDLNSLLPLALRQLRLLAGESAPHSSSADWAAWWLENREKFRAKRGEEKKKP